MENSLNIIEQATHMELLDYSLAFMKLMNYEMAF